MTARIVLPSKWWRLMSLSFVVCWMSVIPQCAQAQYNTDRLLAIGRSALYYEDYVLSIQYFNQAITAKPWLYEPWFMRAVAKYHLDDIGGAERDCSEAISRNPYVVGIYELRGLTRIRQENYSGAISDFNRALHYAPENRGLWHNRVLCHIQNKEFAEALSELDTMQVRWSNYAAAYNMRADVYMQQADTTLAIEALQKSIELDPYDGHTWASRSIISLARSEWKDAEKQLDEAIRLIPKSGGYYINRALARYNQNNLRGAMADYDVALDLEPNNFIGHYNRGLLRTQVGDDNRAIADFDFVLALEPDNMLALFNRGVLLDRTGDLHGAIRDYSKVISEYPDFWTGLEYRARCYRRLGMNAKAEIDEFAVYKARLYTHLYGPQISKKQGQRKRSDLDPEKYNQLVEEDEREPEREYQSDYRGRVQDRKTDMDYQPMFAFSLEKPHSSEVKASLPFDPIEDEMNSKLRARTIYINNKPSSLDSEHSNDYFSYIDSLTTAINGSTDTGRAVSLLFSRAVAYTALQDYQAASDDLDTYLQTDSMSVPALWQRAVCQSKISRFQAAEGMNVDLKTAGALSDFNHALAISPHNPYLHFNRATLYVQRGDYAKAIDGYTEALSNDSRLAEAYYNRGLCYIHEGQTVNGITDLSLAGELGLYQAYSIIKKYRK